MSGLETLEERVSRVNGLVQQQLFQKNGVSGIRSLKTAFKLADCNGNKKLDKGEFADVLSFSGLFLTKQDISLLFRYYDQGRDGSISYDDFISGLAEDISKNKRRHAMVAKVFAMMDRSGDGVIDTEDVKHLYNAKGHPEVVRGDKSEEQVLREYLKGFEGKQASQTKDGRITWAEFASYYTELSASIPSDVYFITMMENVWKIREDGTVDKLQLRIANLLKILKEKVRQKTPVGREEKETLYQTFKFFDRDDSKAVTREEFKLSMEKYGLRLPTKDLTAFFGEFDSDDSGTINYTEFISKVFADDISRSWAK